MATRYAVATGNWSNTATWDGGTLPTASDDVFADGKTVTIDQNVTVLSLRNTQRSGGTLGGGFTVSGAFTINASGGSGFISGASSLLTVTTASPTTTTTLGAISATGLTTTAFTFSGTGTLTHTGNINDCVRSPGILVTANGTLNVTGNLTGNSGTSGGTNAPIGISGAPTVTVIGNATAGNGAGGSAIRSTGATLLTITGTITGSATQNNADGACLFASAGTFTVNGTLTASASPAIAGVYTSVQVTGPFISSATGVIPINTISPIILSPISNNEFRFRKTVSGTSSLFSSDVTSGAPTANNVRSGTVYGGGTLTGTLAVPNPAYVLLGIATDDTTGTYDGANEFWKVQTSAITTAGSIGERLKNASTVDSTGAQIAAIQ